MFDTAFATLFKAVDRIRLQLESAAPELRMYLAEELLELRQLGDQYMDHWLALDEQILELLETYDIQPVEDSLTLTFSAEDNLGLGSTNPLPAWLGTDRAAAPDVSFAAQAAPDVDASDDDVLWHLQPPGEAADWGDFAFLDLHRVNAAFRRGMGYFDLLLFKEAAASLSEVVQSVKNPVAQIYLAAALAAQGEADEALRHLDSVRAHSSDPLFWCAANEVEAQLRVQRGELDAAIHCLEDSCERMPDYQDVWYNLGICLSKKSAWQAAAAALEQAWRLDPDDIDAATLLGFCQLQEGDVDEAARTCQALLRRYPRHPRVRFLQSRVFLAQGRPSRAVQLCRQLVDLYPEMDGPWDLLTWTLLHQGQPEEAIPVLKKRLSLMPGSHSAMLQLGVAHLLCASYERAEQAFLQCLPKSENKSLLWIALGRVSAAQRDAAKAHRRFLRALRDPRKEVKQLSLYYMGVTLYEANRLQEAQKYLRAALVLGPPNSAVLIALGRIADRMGRHVEANQLFTRAANVSRADRVGTLLQWT
ncbi:tetratricopeptide repeat protein [Alicyclobacillus cycloheptanicus]|uniref:Tetratricopeptide (TPR) repeat protein n=1 Tax=Alicyclobacillus cycloheptanicus TaxID=1457 RepID=A0ABT9XE50_9BACL|nr:tetratricopeptide repeat protein [Alicyclobacillus cycloheptanicus]MDQ0188571.1 tetratricopeptide (TPR) repeat protein [Alicyclobacillus cycloheptanicus]WDM01252.1 tetratricopeptide repeat protein [Alicyclobacillus cycloheptanicus]